MRTYFEAFNSDDLPILGNLDGQGVHRGPSYRRTKHYRELLLRNEWPKWPRVKFWRVVTEDGRVLETIPNSYWKEASRCPSQPV